MGYALAAIVVSFVLGWLLVGPDVADELEQRSKGRERHAADPDARIGAPAPDSRSHGRRPA